MATGMLRPLFRELCFFLSFLTDIFNCIYRATFISENQDCFYGRAISKLGTLSTKFQLLPYDRNILVDMNIKIREN